MHFNIADLFESIVDRVAERTALVCGAQRRTYAELEERGNRLAHALAARGVGAGDHVALYMTNCAEYVEAMVASFKLRAVPVNVNFRYVEDELRYLLDDSESVAVLYTRELAPRVAAVRERCPRLRAVIAVEDGSDAGPAAAGGERYEELLAAASPARDFAERSAKDLYIVYTGGTTGMPKGVMWEHEDWFFAGMMGGNPMGPQPERPEDVAARAAEKQPQAVMSAAPLIHGAGQLGTWIAMMQGFRACLAPRFDPKLVWQTVQDERAISLSIVGDAMARPLAEALDEPGVSYDLSSLVVLSSAGAILSAPVKAQLRKHFPKLMIMDNFGSSESGSQGVDAGGERVEGGMRFRMNANTVVLDDEGREVEPGSGRIGKVALRGRVPVGYWKDAEKSARTFVEFGGVRHVVVGDFARPEADGTITVFGRGSQCINSGGEKIFPEEVEGALKSHPDVFDALVVGVPDERWGEKVAAVVQLRPGRSPAPDDVIAHCRKHLAGYKVPRFLHPVPEIQRSPSDKADYPWAKRTATAAASDTSGTFLRFDR
ncbi:MAG TPA: acyl-CoA synthetase [Myxococcota bacterium]|nr:acyl-CoA synthetase [Myxococcota bacterium]